MVTHLVASKSILAPSVIDELDFWDWPPSTGSVGSTKNAVSRENAIPCQMNACYTGKGLISKRNAKVKIIGRNVKALVNVLLLFKLNLDAQNTIQGTTAENAVIRKTS